jgi:hypothetical protein
MSWHALTHSFQDASDRTSIWTPIRLPQQPQPLPRPMRSLGTATADARWRWASPSVGCVTTTITESAGDDELFAARLGVACDLRAEMAEMAHVMGRSEDDIWAEAAREWLMRRLRNDGPPPTTPAAAPVPGTRPRRIWNEIDEMLAELRHRRYVAAPAAPTVPAA